VRAHFALASSEASRRCDVLFASRFPTGPRSSPLLSPTKQRKGHPSAASRSASAGQSAAELSLHHDGFPLRRGPQSTPPRPSPTLHLHLESRSCGCRHCRAKPEPQCRALPPRHLVELHEPSYLDQSCRAGAELDHHRDLASAVRRRSRSFSSISRSLPPPAMYGLTHRSYVAVGRVRAGDVTGNASSFVAASAELQAVDQAAPRHRRLRFFRPSVRLLRRSSSRLRTAGVVADPHPAAAPPSPAHRRGDADALPSRASAGQPALLLAHQRWSQGGWPALPAAVAQRGHGSRSAATFAVHQRAAEDLAQ
jgi:hypothetical protein